jgi:DNA replication protein DnaC
VATTIALPEERRVIQDDSPSSTDPTLMPAPVCELCKGDGYVVAERDARGYIKNMRACECQRSEKIRRRIPSRYVHAKLSDFRPSTQAMVAAWFHDRQSPGLLLYGPVGTGKTHLAYAILRTLLEAGQDVLAVNSASFYRELRGAFNTERTEDSVMAPYCRAAWLLFDDAGAGALTDFERRYLLDLLDQRASLRTIITSNLTVEEFRKRLDERIGSRLSEFTSFHCGGADRRATKNRLQTQEAD